VLEVGEDEGGAGDVADLRLGQVRGALCQHGDDLVEVPVGGDPGDAVVAG
jgi:hypothetical protein